MARKVIQIIITQPVNNVQPKAALIALCDDGTIWTRDVFIEGSVVPDWVNSISVDKIVKGK